MTFSCPPGLVLTGPIASTCMRNGEWEPDLHELKCLGDQITIMFTYNICLISCIAHCNPPSLPSDGQLLPYTSTLEGATVTYVCWNVHQRGRCDDVNVTAVCNKQGYWEPNTDDICAESTGEFLHSNHSLSSFSHDIYLHRFFVK